MVDRFNRNPQRRCGDRPAPVARGCMNTPAPRPEAGGSCGVSNDCKAMLRRLQTVEFTLTDIMLYLDIYPECSEALAYYNKLLEERDALRSSLSRKCKRPTTAFENSGADSWDWIASPWPWDPSAN